MSNEWSNNKEWLDVFTTKVKELYELQKVNATYKPYLISKNTVYPKVSSFNKIEVPFEHLQDMAMELGLSTKLIPFGKPGEYPEYAGQLICEYNGCLLYELISKE